LKEASELDENSKEVRHEEGGGAVRGGRHGAETQKGADAEALKAGGEKAAAEQQVRDGGLNQESRAAEPAKEDAAPPEADRRAQLNELAELKEKYALLSARYEAEMANRGNAAASTGSVESGRAARSDSCTPDEWDALPDGEKEKFIRSGKVFDFMKKWSVRR
jgi:hypothetical protein